MKKLYYYIYDMDNREYTNIIFDSESKAKEYLARLTQQEDIDEYLQSPDCWFRIDEYDHQLF